VYTAKFLLSGIQAFRILTEQAKISKKNYFKTKLQCKYIHTVLLPATISSTDLSHAAVTGVVIRGDTDL
jgi:hypothetical protein